MQIFLDSADLTEIEHWLSQGVIDGVTTNPTVLLKDKVYDVQKGIRRIGSLLGNSPISVEVTTNDLKEMIDQAREYSKWGSNIVVKIPVVNEVGDSCLWSYQYAGPRTHRGKCDRSFVIQPGNAGRQSGRHLRQHLRGASSR